MQGLKFYNHVRQRVSTLFGAEGVWDFLSVHNTQNNLCITAAESVLQFVTGPPRVYKSNHTARRRDLHHQVNNFDVLRMASVTGLPFLTSKSFFNIRAVDAVSEQRASYDYRSF